jgi:hypothetical protein
MSAIASEASKVRATQTSSTKACPPLSLIVVSTLDEKRVPFFLLDIGKVFSIATHIKVQPKDVSKGLFQAAILGGEILVRISTNPGVDEMLCLKANEIAKSIIPGFKFKVVTCHDERLHDS